MPLALSKRVWVLAERLYIHASESEQQFLTFLGGFGIVYHGEPYREFGTLKGHYTFMSEPNYSFADFMERVPSHKYLALLEAVVSDPNIQKTQRNNWNYYGEHIRNWYPELLSLLNLAGVVVDDVARRLAYTEPDLAPAPGSGAEFLSYAFGDPFLDYMRQEANGNLGDGRYLSVMFVTRKILETIVVRLFEAFFPKLENGQYNSVNHELWYDKRRGCYHDFESY